MSTCNESCNPCTQVNTTQESVASWLSNLTTSIFGTITKTIVNGIATWSAPCDLDDTGLACWPKLASEGWVCYILRLIGLLGIFPGGTWSDLTTYCKNTFVTYSGIAYVSLSAVPAGSGTPASRPDLWLPVVGPGPQGPPGPSGAGSAVNFAYRVLTVSDTLVDADAVVICKPVAGAIVVTLPQIAATLSGKWFKIWVDGAFNVQLAASGVDDIQVGATIAATYNLTSAGEAVELVSAGGTRWYAV